MVEKKRKVVLEGPEGSNPEGEEFVPGLPVFKRGIPQALPERTAKELLEGAGDRFKLQTPKKKAKEEE